MNRRPAFEWSSRVRRLARAMSCAAALAGVAACGSSASPASYTVGGTVSGLAAGQSLQLQDNGGDTLTVDADGTFVFPARVGSGHAFAITVATPPAGQSCAVTAGTGVVSDENVADTVVTCSNLAYPLAGTVSGVALPGLVLANGTDTVAVAAGATAFAFATPLPFGASYAIQVQSSPAGTTCTVMNGTGTMPAGGATAVAVTCSSQAQTISGSLSASTNLGVVIGDGVEGIVMGPGVRTFTFPTPVAEGSAYDVTVLQPPTGQVCSVAGGAGVMGPTAVTDVVVTCSATAFPVGGTIAGLTGSGLVLANDGGSLAVAANATAFTMPAPVADQGAYAVVVAASPAGQTCSVARGSGTISGVGVTDVAVTCTSP